MPDTPFPLITLPHTALTVPLRHPEVVALRTLDLSCGQAFRAEVWWGGEHVGWFENTGAGGATTFQPPDSRRRPDPVVAARLAAFVEACTHPRFPISPSTVFTLLVEEHDQDQLVLDAGFRGGTVARYLVGGQPIGVFAEVDLPPARWAEPAADLDLLDLLTALEPANGFLGGWQVWDGFSWRDLVSAADRRRARPAGPALSLTGR